MLESTRSQIWKPGVNGILGSRQKNDPDAYFHGVVVGGEHFGSSLAVGDFDGDGFADLAIGAPEEFGDGGPAASVVVHYGAVQVLYGSTSGLATARNQRFTINSSGFPIDPVFYESSDAFGYALAAGDFNGDNKADLAIGVPGRYGGAVIVLRGAQNGLSTSGAQISCQQQFWDPECVNDVGQDLSAGYGVPSHLGISTLWDSSLGYRSSV